MKKFLAIVAVLAILFSLAVPALAADGASSEKENGGAASGGASTSPQTGFDATAWSMAMGGLLLGAGICFVSARKKVTE